MDDLLQLVDGDAAIDDDRQRDRLLFTVDDTHFQVALALRCFESES